MGCGVGGAPPSLDWGGPNGSEKLRVVDLESGVCIRVILEIGVAGGWRAAESLQQKEEKIRLVKKRMAEKGC